MGSTGRIFTRKKNKNGTWSPWSSVITDSQIGDGITSTNGIIPVPEVISSGTQFSRFWGLLVGSLMRVFVPSVDSHWLLSVNASRSRTGKGPFPFDNGKGPLPVYGYSGVRW